MEKFEHVQIVMTEKDEEEFKKSKKCHICNNYFAKNWKNQYVANSYKKVRDHDHITGKFRGAAHSSCNLQWNIKNGDQIPVFFHNLRGYDSHLIMQEIHNAKGSLSCIANNSERYVSFSIDNLKFVDSVQFLNASLAKLTDNTVSSVGINGMQHVNHWALHNKDHKERMEQRSELIPLLVRKGVYPYDAMDRFDCFNWQNLPEKKDFYSTMNKTGITDEDYEHAKRVFKDFECKNMGDYCDLYCRTDVLLLADIFKNYRKTCLNIYKLDPARYFTSPGLAWDALLLHSGIELELLTDYDKYLFVERGLRGGVSMASERYAKANNPSVEGYDPNKPKTWIMYNDANNLYGWAMSQPMPTGGFKWVTNPDSICYEELPADHPIGYILEVDLEYPEELHDAHNSYPLAPERLSVKQHWISPYQQDLLGGQKVDSTKKLIPNLVKKERYIIHYKNLELYEELGMKCTKIHRVLQFRQRPWMKSYIDMNTQLRAKTKSAFEKDLFKLMNNSVYGKTMENLRKRIDFRLVKGNEDEKIRRLTVSPALNYITHFNENLAGFKMEKTSLYLNKPIYVGFCVLELSKWFMYDYYYKKLKPRYGEKVEVLYTDTDSLLLEIETDDVYKDMKEDIDLYDTSDFPEGHPLQSNKNKKVPGKMKDEMAGTPIREYVGLRSKMYSILTENQRVISKAKGVSRATLKNIKHELFLESLTKGSKFRHEMKRIRSKNHMIYMETLNKVSISPLDTKRWLLDDGVNTYSYGNYLIANRKRPPTDAT